MTPLRRATGGADQEKVTCLSPASATNISGAPAGELLRIKLILLLPFPIYGIKFMYVQLDWSHQDHILLYIK